MTVVKRDQANPDPPKPCVVHTISDKALYQGPTKEGPWTPCKELPAPRGVTSARRAWSVTDRFTTLSPEPED